MDECGAALDELGGRESGTERLDEAVRTFREALTVRTRERMPYPWALTQENLALAEVALFERTDDAARLSTAAERVAEALVEYREAGASYDVEIAERLAARIADLR